VDGDVLVAFLILKEEVEIVVVEEEVADGNV
jgi:hypothetical protein